MPSISEPTPEFKLAEHVDAIRALGKQTVANIIEIGCRLTDAKNIAGHGNWLPWLDREFGWKEQTARNFMRAYELSLKSPKFADLALPLSGLYLLAAPSTPPEARDEIIERAEAGEALPVAEVKRVVEKHKDHAGGRKQPARKGWSRERYKHHRAKKRQAREQKKRADTWNAMLAEVKPRVEATAARLVEADASLARDVLHAVTSFGPCGMADGVSPTSHLFVFALEEALAAREEAPPPAADGLDIPECLRRDRVSS